MLRVAAEAEVVHCRACQAVEVELESSSGKHFVQLVRLKTHCQCHSSAVLMQAAANSGQTAALVRSTQEEVVAPLGAPDLLSSMEEVEAAGAAAPQVISMARKAG